jgi:hypothetical protein
MPGIPFYDKMKKTSVLCPDGIYPIIPEEIPDYAWLMFKSKTVKQTHTRQSVVNASE